MPGTGNTLMEAEWSWFKTRSENTSLATNTHVAELKRRYFISVVGERNQAGSEPLEQLEWRWLKSLTGVTGSEYADMWREAVVGAGQVPSNSIDENKFIYYKTVI